MQSPVETMSITGVHRWTVLIDAKEPIQHRHTPVVTHHYSRTGTGIGESFGIQEQLRLVVLLSPTPDADDLWGYTVKYRVELAYQVDNPVWLTWSGAGVFTTHSAALTHMEDMARKFGWNG